MIFVGDDWATVRSQSSSLPSPTMLSSTRTPTPTVASGKKRASSPDMFATGAPTTPLTSEPSARCRPARAVRPTTTSAGRPATSITRRCGHWATASSASFTVAWRWHSLRRKDRLGAPVSGQRPDCCLT